MKNKVFIRALLATIFAFMLYSASLREMNSAKINIIEPKNSKVNKKQIKEPKVKMPTASSSSSQTSASSKVTVEKGSKTSLASAIKKAMGSTASYQVAVQDLNNSARYARLATTSEAHNASGVLKILILATIYYQEQKGKLSTKTAIKIKKSDRVKGEKLLQTNMGYSIAYLRQAMMKGNKTAGNALLRKAGSKNVAAVAKKFGATSTTISGTFTNPPVGKTTSKDLYLVLKGLYQGKVLNQSHAQLVLLGLYGSRTKLTSGISGTIYSAGDSHFAAAIVQTSGHSYCISAWSNSQKNFKALGKAVNTWFNKNRS